MPAGYVAETTADVALTAATAKTILSVINSATGLIRVTEISGSFDGISSTAEPVTVELGLCTTTGAGTSTSHTIVQNRGPTRTVQATAKRNYTAEPSTITVIRQWLVHPQTGITVQFPLGREPEQITASQLILIRCTAPATVNARGHIEFEEG